VPIAVRRRISFRKASEDAILNAANQMEPKLHAAFLKAVERLRDQIPVGKLTDAIESGGIHQVLAIMAVDEKFTNRSSRGGSGT
jgi:hypothetical protein